MYSLQTIQYFELSSMAKPHILQELNTMSGSGLPFFLEVQSGPHVTTALLIFLTLAPQIMHFLIKKFVRRPLNFSRGMNYDKSLTLYSRL